MDDALVLVIEFPNQGGYRWVLILVVMDDALVHRNGGQHDPPLNQS